MIKDSRRKTSRAVILPFPGDPFLLQYWYTLFKKVWYHEVDKLYICHNSTIEPEAVEFMKEMVAKDDKVFFIHHSKQIDHGNAINYTLDIVKEDYVMLVEDDAFIFGHGVVSQCFNLLECGAYDIVGSKRGSCTNEILEAALDKWGIGIVGLGDQGPNFWPNFFFCKKELLLKTDRRFCARQWEVGEKIEGLDHVCKETQNGDTFVNTSLQLRGMVPKERIKIVPQYHGHPDDQDHYDKKIFLFDGKAPWFHVGSLSTGIGALIQDDFGRSLTRRKLEPPNDKVRLDHPPTSGFEKREYERRVQWWLAFYWSAGAIGLSDLRNDYKNGIERIIDQFRLTRVRLSQNRQRRRGFKQRYNL